MADRGQNVVVCCRFRPPNAMELERGNSQEAIEFVGNTDIYLDQNLLEASNPSDRKATHVSKTVFSFDRVFTPNAPQETVFEYTAKKFADEVMRGFNCTIFAYGQTGSGKTYTMMGEVGTKQEGIIPRLTRALFDYMEHSSGVEFTVKLSYVEIYMEHIRDLLDPGKDNLQLRESQRGVWIQDVREEYVRDLSDVMELLRVGSQQRSTAATNMNDESSRSHSVLIITIGQRNKAQGTQTGSKLILVDLAGSETVRKTGASGTTLKEAQYINKSLSALGNVINALTTNAQHVPYRDSKLTRLLTDSLGGNSKTCLIITCSAHVFNLEETLSTLRFGARAKKIKNKPIINQEKSVAEYKLLLQAAVDKVAEHELTIAKLQKINRRLRDIIRSSGLGYPDDLEAEIEEAFAAAAAGAGGGDVGGGSGVAAAAGGGRADGGGEARDEDDLEAFSPRLRSNTNDINEEDLEPDESKGGDVKDLTQRARSSSTVLHNLELQGQVRFFEQDVKEKEEALRSMTEEMQEKDHELEAYRQELKEREERIAQLQKDLYDAVAKAPKAEEAAAAAAAAAAAGGAAAGGGAGGKDEQTTQLKRRVELLEKEQEVYLKQIDRLQADNLELAQLNEVARNPLRQAAVAAAAAAAAPAAGAGAGAGAGAAGGGGDSAAGAAAKAKGKGHKKSKSGDSAASGGRSASESSSGSGSDSGSDSDSDDDEARPGVLSLKSDLEAMREKYEVMMKALGRKCEQYLDLQTQLASQSQRIAELQQKAEQKDVSAEYEERIRVLEKRLEAADELCQKLLKSGQYWQERGQRKERELQERIEAERAVLGRPLQIPAQPASSSSSSSAAAAPNAAAAAAAAAAAPRHSSHIVVPVHISGGARGASRPYERQNSMDQFF